MPPKPPPLPPPLSVPIVLGATPHNSWLGSGRGVPGAEEVVEWKDGGGELGMGIDVEVDVEREEEGRPLLKLEVEVEMGERIKG